MQSFFLLHINKSIYLLEFVIPTGIVNNSINFLFSVDQKLLFINYYMYYVHTIILIYTPVKIQNILIDWSAKLIRSENY